MNKYNDKGYKTYRLYGSVLIIVAALVTVSVIFVLSITTVKYIYIDDLSHTDARLNNPTDPVVSDMLRNKFAYLYGKRLVQVNSIEEAKKIREELPYIDKFYIRRDIFSRTVLIQYSLKNFYGSYQDEKTREMRLLGSDGALYPVYTLSKYEAMKGRCFVLNRGAGDTQSALLLKGLVRSNLPDSSVVYMDSTTFDVDYNHVYYKMGLYKDFKLKIDKLASLSGYLSQRYDPATIEYVSLASYEFPAVKFKK